MGSHFFSGSAVHSELPRLCQIWASHGCSGNKLLDSISTVKRSYCPLAYLMVALPKFKKNTQINGSSSLYHPFRIARPSVPLVYQLPAPEAGSTSHVQTDSFARDGRSEAVMASDGDPDR